MINEDDGRWHLDKRVPLSMIGAIILQTFAAGWLIASLQSVVLSQGARISILEGFEIDRFKRGERLAVLESTSQVVKEDLRDIKAILQKLLERERTTK